MRQRFKKWDRSIAKRFPKLWVLGLHIYVPVILAVWLLFYAMGWTMSGEPLPTQGAVNDYADKLLLYSILPTIVIGVLYFIRQIKFNALRVHHHLPFKNPFIHYFTFLLVCVLFTAIPMTSHLGLYHNMSSTIHEREFNDDLSHLNRGIVHFYQDEYARTVFEAYDYPAVANSSAIEGTVEAAAWQTVESIAVSGENRIRSTYRWNETKDSLILYRSYLERDDDYYYSGERVVNGSYWDTISVAQAHLEIAEFKNRAAKYNGEIEALEPDELIKNHIAHNEFQMTRIGVDQEQFDLLLDVTRFKEVVGTHARISFRETPFKCSEWSFWNSYLFLGLYLSFLLFILSSVKLADFGWALLAGSLTAVSYGIIIGLVLMNSSNGYHDQTEEYLNLILLTVFTLGYLWVMCGRRFKNGLKKAFGIAFQVFLPHLVMCFFALFDALHTCPYTPDYPDHEPCLGYEYFQNDEYYLVGMCLSIAFAILGIWFFNRYYKKRYVYPDTSR